MSTLDVIVGGQFGSEGKGHVTAQVIKAILSQSRPVLNIRVAGPNAGHTVIDAKGNSFALRCIPVGAAVSLDMPDVEEIPGAMFTSRPTVAIAPGSEIHPEVFVSEMDLLRQYGHRFDLIVAGEATILTPEHQAQESADGISQRIGSTGKGIGAARAARVWRTAQRVQDNPGLVDLIESYGGRVLDAVQWEEYIDAAENTEVGIVIEGTQGYGLGQTAGHYPQVTSSNTRNLDFLAMAGVTPWACGNHGFCTWVVARVYPIRVAGNSGALKGETSWDDLGLPEEHTTVTHKVRRVGDWDGDLVRRAVRANGGHHAVMVAVTMVDQKFPQVAGHEIPWGDDAASAAYTLDPAVKAWLEDLQDEVGAAVGLVTTSPSNAIWL